MKRLRVLARRWLAGVFTLSAIPWSGAATSVVYGVLAGGIIAMLVFPLDRQLKPESRGAIGASTVQLSQFEPDGVPPPAVRSLPAARFAEFGDEPLSADARHVANWVADARDNAQHDFVIVDKKFAKVYVFDAQARLRGASPVLLGAAPGDDSVPDIGTRALSDVRLEERTTPAGRFLAQRGRNSLGEDVIWVDYEAAVSMHRVRATVPSERRLERLASKTADDNRISWGCINVPVAFFEQLVQPVFEQRKAVVYVLPEEKTVEQVFGSYDVVARQQVPSPG